MNPRVLILDDSLTVRMDLATAFDAAGCTTSACATAAEARAHLAGSSVDVIVLDVLLPDADGVELLAELRATPAGRDAVILVLSTEAEVGDRVRGLRTGADEYVGKPYDSRYVVAKAQELHRARSEARPDATTILVIDDSITFREELRRACEEGGYRVLTAGTGEDGLRTAAVHRPDAVVVDGQLPDIDGGTVIRRIRLDVALRSVPCVLLTGSEDGRAELRALDAGADSFMRKEDDVSVVLARLGALLRHAQPLAPAPGERSTFGPKRILAVDDSLTYLHELAARLRGDGYDVVLARSGEESLELLGAQAVDCILLDLVMPGLGGCETCRRVKAVPTLRDVPLIMLTATENRDAMIDALGAGADDYIQKSSEFEVLTARVRAQLRRKQFEDEHRRIREQLLARELEAAEARSAAELAETRAVLIAELERKNEELEAFSYSVSHDLRAPLRSIDGFSQALMEDCADRLDDTGADHLRRVRAATQRMGELIDDLLSLSRVGRAELRREPIDLSAIATSIAADLAEKEPERAVVVEVASDLHADADGRLVRAALENLIGNAWKFTGREDAARVEIGCETRDGERAFFVRDNGDGFEPKYASRLFQPFQRLHTEEEFPGTGIGLATVRRIVERHGGRVWADGEVGVGATVWFTIGVPAQELVS